MDIASSSYVGRDFAVSNDNNNNNNFITVSDPSREEEYSRYKSSYDKEYDKDYSDSGHTSPRSDRSDRSGRHSPYPKKSHHGDDKEDKEKILVVEKDSDFMDYRLVWFLGFFLLLISFLYFYWLSVECNVPENDETNLTMQYALEKYLNNDTDPEPEARDEAVQITSSKN
jgi:hypothetical protein